MGWAPTVPFTMTQSIPKRWDGPSFPRAMLRCWSSVPYSTWGRSFPPSSLENNKLRLVSELQAGEKELFQSRALDCALAAVSEQIGDAALPRFNRVSVYSCVGETLHYLAY